MAVALDSSAVIGFLDEDDAFHAAADTRIRDLLKQGEQLHASAVTYAEVLTGATLGHHDEEIVRGFFADLVSEIAPADHAVAERAAELRGERRSLRMPDALIMATADLDREVDLIVCSDASAEELADLIDCRIEPLTAKG